METLKTLPEFVQVEEDARKAKESIEIARVNLLEARKLSLDKLLKKKEEIEVTINSYEKKLKELSKQLKKECSQNGHNMVFISQRRISDKRGAHTFINPGGEYKITYKCAVCGYTTTYKGKMVLRRPAQLFTETQNEIMQEYNNKKDFYEKVLVDSKQELKKVEKLLAEICLYFGHETVKNINNTHYECLCCGKTFNFTWYTRNEKDINNFLKTPKELLEY